MGLLEKLMDRNPEEIPRAPIFIKPYPKGFCMDFQRGFTSLPYGVIVPEKKRARSGIQTCFFEGNST